MCLTLREADAMVAYMKRYDPGYRYAREIVRRLHDVRYVQVNVLHPAEAPNYAHHRLHRGSDLDSATLGCLQEESRALVRESIGDVPEHASTRPGRRGQKG